MLSIIFSIVVSHSRLYSLFSLQSLLHSVSSIVFFFFTPTILLSTKNRLRDRSERQTKIILIGVRNAGFIKRGEGLLEASNDVGFGFFSGLKTATSFWFTAMHFRMSANIFPLLYFAQFSAHVFPAT